MAVYDRRIKVRVEIKNVESYEEEEAVIKAVKITGELQNAIDIIENNCHAIPVISQDGNVMCPTDKIYYIESIDKRTYIYTKGSCFETKFRLYELEERLNRNFFRAAKAMIVNLRKVKSVKSEINGRMTAELLNGEKIVIARSYVKELKERLGI